MPGIYNVFLVLDIILASSLLAFAIKKKQVIIGEDAMEIVKQKWKIFSATIFIGIISAFLFLLYEIIEFYNIVFEKGAEFTALESTGEIVTFILAILIFLILSLNFYLVYLITERGEKAHG